MATKAPSLEDQGTVVLLLVVSVLLDRSALLSRGFSIADFRCPEREESFLGAEFSSQMVPAGDQVGTSALPTASD